MSRIALALAVLLLVTARCPVGCRRDEPARVLWGPPETVPTHQVAPCTWAFDKPGFEPYPRSEAGHYGIHVNGLFSPREWFRVDMDAGTITVTEPECRKVRSFEVIFTRKYRMGPP